MKKGFKVLATIGAAALTTVAVTSCGEKTTSEESKTIESSSQEAESSSAEAESSSASAESSSKAAEKTITLDTTNVTLQYVKGSKFDYKGLVVKDSNGETLTEGDEDGQYFVDISALNLEEDYLLKVNGEYTITVAVNFAGQETPAIATFKITVADEIVKEIATVADFLAMRQEGSGETVTNNYSYKLTADIDLTGVEIPDAMADFRGTFDGQGHTIKNASYVAGTSKVGLMFKTINGNGTVKNVHFFNCSATNANETVALVAGEITAAGKNVITLEDIEVSMCTISTTKDYAGLLIGRIEGAATCEVELNFERITAKNFTSVTCASYGGGLIGDTRSYAGTSVSAKNCDLDFDTTTSQNGSQIVGRNRGGISVSVENVIFRGNIDAKGATSTAYVLGGNKSCNSLSIKNVVVLGTLNAGASDLLVAKDTTAASKMTVEKVFFVNTTKENANYTKINASDFTYAWATTTLGLPTDVFEEDSAKVVHVKGTSSNTPGASATVSRIVLSTDSVKKEFFTTDTFNYNNLAVATVWSDGCTTAAEASNISVVLKNSENQTVDSSDLSKLAVGSYSVEVTVNLGDKGSATSTYGIDIVKYTGITAYTDDIKLVYAEGQKLDLTELYVYAALSNNTTSLLKADKFTVSLKNSAAEAVDVTSQLAEGDYTVTVTFGEFKQEFNVSVLKAVDKVAHVEVIVNPLATTGTKLEGVYQFNTLEKAVNYIDSLDLDEDAVKTIYVKNGTYKEKVYISTPNVSIIGESKENTIITFDAAEGTPKLDGNGSYMMDCATLTVNASAKNFALSNITVRNDFPYFDSELSSKQAFALRCDADKSTFNNVYFYGVQDTLYANTGRQYYYNCRIDGAVDYVFGEGKACTAYFETCVFHSVSRNKDKNNGYVFAPKTDGNKTTGVEFNYVVNHCVFEADETVPEGSMSVARTWGANANVTILNSTFSKAYSKQGYGATGDVRYGNMGGDPAKAFFYEYNNTGDGAISEAVAGVTLLTSEQASRYTIANIFAKVNGVYDYGDAWAPVTEEEKDATKVKETNYVAYYTLGTDKYQVGDTFVASTISAFKVTYDSTSKDGVVVETITPTEVIKNAAGETVDAATMLRTVGEYTVTLEFNSIVLETKTINVNAAGVVEHSESITADALVAANAELASTGEAEGVEHKTDGMTVQFYTKGNVGSRNLEKAASSTVTYEGTTYNYAMQLSGGKTAFGTTLDNVAQLTFAHKGKVTIIVGAKNASSLGFKPTLWASDKSTKVKEHTDALPSFGSVIAFEVEVEAGTYYFGTQSSGCWVYAINYTYSA